MNVKIHSSELNRMMKTIVQCIDQRSMNYGNIEIIHDNNLLSIRGTNGSFSAVMSTPLLGSDGEVFRVDGTMFAKVVGMCNGEVSIITDAKTCTIKGAGRTRIPIVDAKIPAFERVTGNTSAISGSEFSKCFNAISYAISTEQSRPVLTGAMVTAESGKLEMVALDGFQMAVESAVCEGNNFQGVIPGGFMKLIATSALSGEDIRITVGKNKVQAETDGMLISCSLLNGDFPDQKKILPTTFKTETIVSVETLRNALKSGSVVNTGNNLVKLNVSQDSVTIMSNSEQADFDADIQCETQGEGLSIAFNQKYMMNTINAIPADEIVMKFNSSISPCIIQGRDQDGIHLVLPVRTRG